ncbi:murein hydrolase activator EnvC family protein [Paraburkholderia phenazinium]|uniref:Lipoprotein NlpD n=1 Tax=Paraburkholderia phenazinium TaxID=60549 RepID=A0A1N6FX33_9BURK|nr:peptidoglycan DD-metalloendopeptidase family protein [Paraburkholderia phenazinium]SIN99865.1 lipoprotein NlpD [Paraburkholderia phenazinium]
MYLHASTRWRLLLLCATLTTFTGCVSTHRPVASPEDTEAQSFPVPMVEVSSVSSADGVPLPVEAGFYRANAGDTLVSIAKSSGRAPASAKPNPAVSVKRNPAPASAEASRFKWPVSGAVAAKFAAGRSKGVELGGRLGDPVKAAGGGRVVYSGVGVKPYGRLIVIRHDDHFVTAYGGLRKLLVGQGAVVKQGQSIAEMGADTNGNGSLKFEVRKDGKPVDPLIYLPKRQG